ncbi:MAG: hypothetical protein U0795_16615 [Pirellulales bacterium]
MTAWEHWFIHPHVGTLNTGPSHPLGEGLTVVTCLPPSAVAFTRSFEEVCESLAELPRMFVEPDGSFVWRTPSGQLDGQLHDGPCGLAHIELKGSISLDDWRRWLACVGWPDQSLAVQLARDGIFISESEFARLLQPDA